MFSSLPEDNSTGGFRTPFTKSLRFRVVVFSSVIFGLMIAAIVLNSILVIKRAMIEHIRVSTQQTSEILNLAVAPYSTNNDFGTLKIFLDELIGPENTQSGLIYLIIGHEDGTPLLTSGNVDLPIPVPDTPEHYAQALNRGIVHVRIPLLLAHNTIGFMQYGLSFNLMVAATNRLNRDGILMAIGGVIVTLIIMLLLMLKIVRRIYALANVSRSIVEGDFSLRSPVYSQDEICMLSTHFNLMADSIQQRIQEITKLNLVLEARVEERTKALVSVNEALEQTIADLKWTQESLVRSEKLAGLGALVAGIAHELNTPIGNALTVASTLQDYTRSINQEFITGLSRSSLERFLTEAASAGDLLLRNLQKTADLVTSFKHVAVDQISEHRREFELHATIEEILATLSPLLKKTPYTLRLTSHTTAIMNSYPGALGQVITNLVTNALLHGFVGRSQGNITLNVSQPDNDDIKLVFRDDGCGMTSEIQQHIFDPFFTTRFGKGGSGLGMSIVHNLVTVLLKGTIQVNSEPDQGTEFTLYLPKNP